MSRESKQNPQMTGKKIIILINLQIHEYIICMFKN